LPEALRFTDKSFYLGRPYVCLGLSAKEVREGHAVVVGNLFKIFDTYLSTANFIAGYSRLAIAKMGREFLLRLSVPFSDLLDSTADDFEPVHLAMRLANCHKYYYICQELTISVFSGIMLVQWVLRVFYLGEIRANCH